MQAVMTFAAVAGLLVYHRRTEVEQKLLGMGFPDELAEKWAEAFPRGFALALATVPAEHFDETQDAFLDGDLEAPLAVDRRPVL